ncbi:MAG: DNA-deoxyinosine glycosylase [Clostridia bacterium]|nr:DNA-deoxyinosine glycosylase [Clostridia bacterium]
MTVHPIEPVYDLSSRVLILGSFPSVKSRETGFFYGHPQNRFWRVLAAALQTETPRTIAEKKTFLLENGIALWDVVGACEITGSSDVSIRNAVPNDLGAVFAAAPVRAVFTNGKTADRLYDRFFGGAVSLPKYCLPSTSPANASYGFEKLLQEWKTVADFLSAK